jgi:hypothetical protein
MHHTVPEPPPNAEDLANALYDGAVTNLAGAAATLLCDIPGHLYAQPGFAPYITTHTLPDGRRTAEIAWPAVGGDLLAGQTPITLSHAHRALLMIAASIAGGPAVHLGALLSHLDSGQLNLVIGALQRAAGIW